MSIDEATTMLCLVTHVNIAVTPLEKIVPQHGTKLTNIKRKVFNLISFMGKDEIKDIVNLHGVFIMLSDLKCGESPHANQTVAVVIAIS